MSNKSLSVSSLKFLRVLKNLKKSQWSVIIDDLSDHGIDLLCHCIYNIVFEDHKLKRGTKNKLRRILNGKEKELEFLSNRGNSIKRRRDVLVNKQFGGGILTLLLSVALPVLTTLLFKSRKWEKYFQEFILRIISHNTSNISQNHG